MAAAADANHSSRTPADVARAEQREDRDDDHVDDEDRDRGLDEHLQPVALADRDDAGHAAQEGVRRELEGVAVEGAADDRDDCDDDRRHRRVEQDGQQHPDGRRRQEVAEDRAPGRDLERQRRPGEQQPDQEDDVVAVPERRSEAPDPGQQHRDDEDGQHQPAREAREVRSVHADAERADRLDVRSVEALAVGDDDLALGDADPDRVDGRRGRVARTVGEGLVERRVRHDEWGDQLRRKRPFDRVEATGHLAGQLRPRLRDVRLAQFEEQRSLEHLACLGADLGPAGGIKRDEGRLRGLGEIRDRDLEQRRPLLGREVRAERGIDPVDPRLEGRRLFRRDGDRGIGRVRVLGRDRIAGVSSRLLGPDLTVERGRARRRDVSSGDLAGCVLEALLGQDVGAEDRGHDHHEDARSHTEARRVAAREARDHRGSVDQHRTALARFSGGSRRARQGPPPRACWPRGR